MLARESALPPDRRMDFVCIVTPNHLHLPIAVSALELGFHVVCDKPMTMNMEEALKIERKVRETGLLFCLTHNYPGYPMVKEARELVVGGEIGEIRRVVVEYAQGWVTSVIEAGGQRHLWRLDPTKVGISFTMGDIGTHAANLAEYVTGVELDQLCADLSSFVAGRDLDDDGSVLLRFGNGARGVLWVSGIAVGEENALSIRVYGTKGAIEWRQMEPQYAES